MAAQREWTPLSRLKPTADMCRTKTSLLIHPTILDFSLPAQPSIVNTANTAIDLIVPASHAAGLSSEEWDHIDEVVGAINGQLAPGKDVGLDRYGGYL
jgi:hypothetical protein